MKRTLKKLSGLLLALCMVLSLLPATVLAAPPTLPTSGIDWSLSASGALAITSDAGMSDWLTNVNGDFTYSNYVTSVVIGDTVTAISNGAFQNRTNITSVTLGNAVETISSNAFNGCSGITSLSIPNSVTTIGDAAFYNCLGITSALVIPASVTSIGAYAFYCCVCIPSLTLSNTAISIGEYAFSGCGTTSLTIPASMTSIGDYAFYGLDGLAALTIPDTVTAIGKGAFSNNSLASVTIPASVTSIGDYAFDNSALENVIFLGTTPPTVGSDVFETASLNSIYVPAGYVNTYKTALSGYAALVYAKTVAITKNSTTTYYPTLSDALEKAKNGDTITLLDNITEEASNAKSSAATVTIDGGGFTVTGSDSTNSVALTLIGTDTIILKNLTLQGGTASSSSTGLKVGDPVSVQSYGIVTVNGGASNYSYGLDNWSTGTVDVTVASASGNFVGAGVANQGSGTVNVGTATGNALQGIGAANTNEGTINVTEATGSNCGVNNQSTGTVNVTTATGTFFGVYNVSTGTVNVTTIISSDVAVKNDSNGKVNAGTISSGTFTTTTNMDVATVALNKGTGASCVLDSITLANSGSTIGTLPDVYKGGACSAQWYTGADLTNLFTMQEISPEATLYSSFYTVPVTPPSGGGGGGGSSTTPSATTATTGNTTTATTTATATTDSNGGVSAAVTGGQITGAIDKAVSGAAAQGSGHQAIVEIKVESAGSAASFSTTIPQTSFSELAGSSVNGLRISTPLASVIFDAAALDAISKKAAGDIKIKAALADTSALTEAAKKAVGDRPVYDLTVTSGSTIISDFGGGSATVALPYTLRAGEDPNAVVVYFLDDSGTLQTMQGRYDSKTGTVTFVTTHFSTYMIGYNKVTFTDVTGDAWYADAVTFLAARGVTTGTTGTNFSPDATLTRGQFITMLLRAYGIPADADTADNFSDAGDSFYTGYLAAAKRLGITNGVGDNKFAPEQAITRQDMFTLLYQALKVLGQLPSEVSGKTLADFTDNGSVSPYAQEAMSYLVKTGTVSGNNGILNPTATTNRAEMAQVLFNLLGK